MPSFSRPQLSVSGKKGISHVAKLGRPHALCLVLESEQSLVIDKLLLCLCLLATMYRSMDLQFNVDQCSFNIRSVLFLITEECSIAVYRWHFSLLSPRVFGIIGLSLMF